MNFSDEDDWPEDVEIGKKFSMLEESLQCPICGDFLNNPMMLKCGHTYCSLCIRKHLDQTINKTTYNVCPSCREKAEVFDLRKNTVLGTAVQAFQSLRPVALKLAKQSLRIKDNNEDMDIIEVFPSTTSKVSNSAVKFPAGIAITKKIAQFSFHGSKPDKIKATLVQVSGNSRVKLRLDGSREVMEKRLREFVHLNNAQIDSTAPLSLEDVIRKVNENESLLFKESVAISRLTNKLEKVKNGETVKDVEDTFAKLTRKMREQKAASLKKLAQRGEDGKEVKLHPEGVDSSQFRCSAHSSAQSISNENSVEPGGSQFRRLRSQMSSSHASPSVAKGYSACHSHSRSQPSTNQSGVAMDCNEEHGSGFESPDARRKDSPFHMLDAASQDSSSFSSCPSSKYVLTNFTAGVSGNETEGETKGMCRFDGIVKNGFSTETTRTRSYCKARSPIESISSVASTAVSTAIDLPRSTPYPVALTNECSSGVQSCCSASSVVHVTNQSHEPATPVCGEEEVAFASMERAVNGSGSSSSIRSNVGVGRESNIYSVTRRENRGESVWLGDDSADMAAGSQSPSLGLPGEGITERSHQILAPAPTSTVPVPAVEQSQNLMNSESKTEVQNEWACGMCTFLNGWNIYICLMCGTVDKAAQSRCTKPILRSVFATTSGSDSRYKNSYHPSASKRSTQPNVGTSNSSGKKARR